MFKACVSVCFVRCLDNGMYGMTDIFIFHLMICIPQLLNPVDHLGGVIWGVHELTILLSHPAPCTPTNVDYTYSCETGIAFLSWDESLGTKSFYAHVRSGDHVATCITSQTDCPLPSLLCGHTYDVEVIGVADHCNSSVPGMAQIQTGKRVRMGWWDIYRECIFWFFDVFLMPRQA